MITVDQHSTLDELAIALAEQTSRFVDDVGATLARYEATKNDDDRSRLLARLEEIQRFRADAERVLGAMPAMKQDFSVALARALRRRAREA
jgi:hypothetical protein